MAKVLVYANRADKLAELVSFARTLGSECLALFAYTSTFAIR